MEKYEEKRKKKLIASRTKSINKKTTKKYYTNQIFKHLNDIRIYDSHAIQKKKKINSSILT